MGIFSAFGEWMQRRDYENERVARQVMRDIRSLIPPTLTDSPKFVIEPKRRRMSTRYVAWENGYNRRQFTPTSARHTAWILQSGFKILYFVNVYARQK